MANCYYTDDNIEGIDTVSLQAVTLVDGSTAYIQHSPKGTVTTHLALLLALSY